VARRPWDMVEIDVPLLQQCLNQRDVVVDYRFWGKHETIPMNRLCAQLGLPKCCLGDAMKSGRIAFYNLDVVACWLGYHPSLFIRSTYVLPEEAMI
jgi:hypothetical protein